MMGFEPTASLLHLLHLHYTRLKHNFNLKPLSHIKLFEIAKATITQSVTIAVYTQFSNFGTDEMI